MVTTLTAAPVTSSELAAAWPDRRMGVLAACGGPSSTISTDSPTTCTLAMTTVPDAATADSEPPTTSADPAATRPEATDMSVLGLGWAWAVHTVQARARAMSGFMMHPSKSGPGWQDGSCS